MLNFIEALPQSNDLILKKMNWGSKEDYFEYIFDPTATLGFPSVLIKRKTMLA